MQKNAARNQTSVYFLPYTGANVIRKCGNIASKYVTQKLLSKPTKFIRNKYLFIYTQSRHHHLS